MALRQLVLIACQISILVMVFGFGLKATSNDLIYVIRRPKLLARSLAAVFVVMPLVAVALVKAFDFRPVVEIALVSLSISPVPPLLPQRETKAGGDRSYAIGLLVVISIVAIAFAPLALWMMTHIAARPLAISPAAVARLALVTILLPLAAGAIVRATLPRLAAAIEKPTALTALILVVLALLPVIVLSAPAMWGLVGDGTLIAMIVFIAIGVAVGHLLGGPVPDHAVVLALSTACRHPAIALTIAAANYPEERFGAAILLYVIVGLLVGAPYVAWLRKQTPAAPAAV